MKTTTDVLDTLRPTLKHKCSLALLDYLASFATRRKLTIGGQQYLQFLGSSDRDAMFLPLGQRGQPKPSLQCSEEMREFYAAFDGLREKKPPTAGYFVPSSVKVTVGEKLDPEDFPGFRKYSACPIIFAAASGDQLIQTPDGKFSWCVVGEGKVKKVADSFSSLLSIYVRHRSVGDGHPFDPYGR